MIGYDDAWQRQAAHQLQYEYRTRSAEAGGCLRWNNRGTTILQHRSGLLQIRIHKAGISSPFAQTLRGRSSCAPGRCHHYTALCERSEPVIGDFLFLSRQSEATMSIAPVAILFAYVLRITTVLIRTPSIEPFLTGGPNVLMIDLLSALLHSPWQIRGSRDASHLSVSPFQTTSLTPLRKGALPPTNGKHSVAERSGHEVSSSCRRRSRQTFACRPSPAIPSA